MMARNALRIYDFQYLLHHRNFSCSHIALDKNDLKGKESKLKGYAMKSYMNYMNHYEQKLEKRFPSAMKIYRLFSDGIKSFYMDLKAFFKIRYVLLGNEEELNILSRKEIELYNQMPKDMLKIAPVLLLSALPLANYVIFPIAYMYPQKFLTSHFWTSQQKESFYSLQLRKRLQYNNVTFKHLKHYSNAVKCDDLKNKWNDVMSLMSNGSHPSVEQLIDCKELFISGPYCINNLHFGHTGSLLHMHGLTAYVSRKQKLMQRAFILKEMDSAINREGGVTLLDLVTLQKLCIMRGLHPSNLNNDEIVQWLQKWISLSNNVERESFSLLLHAPLLIGYNHPNNVKLLQ